MSRAAWVHVNRAIRFERPSSGRWTETLKSFGFLGSSRVRPGAVYPYAEGTMADDNRNLPAMIYGKTVIHDRAEMISLTDMWRAAGADPSKQPAKWRELPSTRDFAAHLADVVLRISEDGLFEVRRGTGAGTWAHWHMALAYARYLNHDFHVWANTVVRNRMEEMSGTPQLRAPAIDGGDPATILLVMQHLQSQAERGKGDARALQRIEAAEGSRCITDTAKMVKMGRDALHKWMQAQRWIYRRPPSDTWVAFQDKERAGLLESVPYHYTGRDGTPRVKMQVLVTPKGMVQLAKLLGRSLDNDGALP